MRGSGCGAHCRPPFRISALCLVNAFSKGSELGCRRQVIAGLGLHMIEGRHVKPYDPLSAGADLHARGHPWE